ncbi:MAG: hypothetical protein WA190_13180 [Usitatibacter sp.]
MNIALPALVVFLLLLPGFIFRYSYKRTEKTLLDFKPFGEATLKSILAAIVLDALWARVIPPIFGYEVDFTSLLALLSGAGALDSAAKAIAKTGHIAWPIYLFFLSLFAFAWVSGRGSRWVIEECGWDKKHRRFSSLFRFDTPWFYLFKGYDEDITPDGVYVAAVVDIDGGPYLYIGVLREYFFAESGELDRLVLSTVVRRRLSSDRQDPSESNTAGSDDTIDSDRYYPIAGDYFVVKYSEIHTLNIRYIRLRPTGPANNDEVE